MSIQRILLLALLLLTAMTVTLLIRGYSDEPPPAPPVAEAPNPPGRVLSAPANPPAVRPPAPEPLKAQPAPQVAPKALPIEEDEVLSEKEQVDAALAQLRSADAEQRIDGAEQLGAYPTREAEQALAQTLMADSDAEVRNTAAQSLGYVEKPTEATLTALFSALEDANEEVRGSALSTLEDVMLGSEEGSKLYGRIQAGLKAKIDARSVPEDTRAGIREILEELTAPSE